ncbi:MAG TPA: ABC transporter substrate-binding protein [Burkholderiales bacterium]|nr:ABC transporter substrate-binding protein [Burkholderiales bacterium]
MVGRLQQSAGPNDPVNDALRKGLADLGYVEGRDYKIEHRGAAGRLDQLPRLAEELVELKVDVIVTATDETTRAAKQATSTIPIVAILYNSPVTSGLIESFNHPGGNITGVAARHDELAGKRLQLFKEMLPSMSNVTVLWDAFSRRELEGLKPAARTLDVRLELVELKPPYDLSIAFKTAKARKAGGVMVLTSPEFYVRSARIGALALENDLPVSSSFRSITEAGGLMSYSTDVWDGFYRAGHFIDRVLKGSNPRNLPFEEIGVKLLINAKTAQALALTVPESIALRADEVMR